MVKPCEACEISLGDLLAVMREGQAVCIGWVGNNEDLACLLSHFVKSFSLLLKNFVVHLQEVLALHAWLAGETSQENANVHILKKLLRIAANLNALK